MTLSLDEAKAIALKYARDTFKRLRDGDEVMLVDRIREYACGWLFTYNSRRFLETRDFKYMLLGNPPIAVRKEDGAIHTFATGRTIQNIESILRAGWPEVGSR